MSRTDWMSISIDYFVDTVEDPEIVLSSQHPNCVHLTFEPLPGDGENVCTVKLSRKLVERILDTMKADYTP